MTEVNTTIEVTHVAEIVGDMNIACDYHKHDWCPKDQAAYSMRLQCPSCGWTGLRLGCAPCKEFLTHTEDGMICRTCDQFTAPARHVFTSIEPLEKKR